MNATKLAIEIFGYCAIVQGALTFAIKRRKGILICKLIGDIMAAIYQLVFAYVLDVPAAYAAFFTNIIAVGRECVFYNRGKKWADSPMWAVGFVVAFAAGTAVKWAGPVSLLPMLGSTVAIIGFYFKNTLITRLCGIPSSVLYLAYGVLIGSSFNVIANVIALVFVAIGLVGEFRSRHTNTPAE